MITFSKSEQWYLGHFGSGSKQKYNVIAGLCYFAGFMIVVNLPPFIYQEVGKGLEPALAGKAKEVAFLAANFITFFLMLLLLAWVQMTTSLIIWKLQERIKELEAGLQKTSLDR